MLKIRGISNAENLLSGVNRFSNCLTIEITRAGNHLRLNPPTLFCVGLIDLLEGAIL